MKNKTFLTIFVFTLLFVGAVAFIAPNAVSAVDSDSTSGGTRRLDTIKEKIKDKIVERKETKAQNAIGARVEHFKRVIARSEVLLEKIQVRIDKAKAAGKDVTEMNALMTDAKAKVSDAKTKLAAVESNKLNVTTKATFKTERDNLKEVMRDLQAAKKDVAGIIRLLKSFNSATSNGQNPQATSSTNPAKLNR